MGRGEPSAAQTEPALSGRKWRGRRSKALKFLAIFVALLILEKIDLFGVSGATAIHSEKIFYQIYSTLLDDKDKFDKEKASSRDNQEPLSGKDIAVFLITEAGLTEREGWPPSFKYHRRNLARIAKQQPRAIFIDIVFRQTKDHDGAAAFGRLVRKIINGDFSRGKEIKVYLAATDIRPLKRLPFQPCDRYSSPLLGPKDTEPPVSPIVLQALESGSAYLLEPDKRNGLFLWDELRFSDQLELVSVQSAGFYRRGVEYQASDLWNNRRTAAVAIYEDATGSRLMIPTCAVEDFEEATFEIAWSTRDLSELRWPWSVDRSKVIETFKEDDKDDLQLNPPQYYDCRSSKNVAGDPLSDSAVLRTAIIAWYHIRQAVRGLIPFLDEEMPRPANSPPWTKTTADVLLRQTCPPHFTMPDYDIQQVGQGYFDEPTEPGTPQPAPPFADRFVFYGAATQVAADLIEPPTHEPIPGVYLHAMAFETLLRTKGEPVGLDRTKDWLSGFVFAVGLCLILLVSEVFDPKGMAYSERLSGEADIALDRSAFSAAAWIILVYVASISIALTTTWVGFRWLSLPPINFLGLIGLFLVRRLPNIRAGIEIFLKLVSAICAWSFVFMRDFIVGLFGFSCELYVRHLGKSPSVHPLSKSTRRRRPRVIRHRHIFLQNLKGVRS